MMRNNRSAETAGKRKIKRNSEKNIEDVKNGKTGEGLKKSKNAKNSQLPKRTKLNNTSGQKLKNKKNRRKKKNQRIILISVIAVVLVILIVFLAVIFGKNNNSENQGYHEVQEGEDISDIQAEVKTSDDYVEPASGTLDIDKIQGFTAASGNVESSAKGTSDENEDSGSSDADSGDSSEPAITLSDPNLTVEAIGSYSGNFLEDGSDEPTANVAAMLITNNSDQMLQIAEITFQVNDTETASFKVTDLPAGTSTLVLEANKREYSEEDSYTYGETATGYMEQPSLEEDKFELVTEDGKITLKNKTDQSYDKVYVYYKYVQLGGAYLGGITYRTPFENVPANGEVESIAAHFNPESSKIMAVQIQQEQ